MSIPHTLYFRIWLRMTTVSAQVALANRLGALLFISAKLLRFGFFFFSIMIISAKTRAISGFSQQEVLLLFFVFTILDTITQMLFREVYRFQGRVVSGDFDLDLLKPLPSLFRPLLGGADPIDLFTLVPLCIGFLFFLWQSGMTFHFLPVVLFFILLLNALLIAASFHILVLALGLVSTEVEHAIMIYRDIWSMGRFPVTIYSGTVRVLLQYVVPVALMVTLPVQILIGQVSPPFVIACLLVGSVSLVVSVLVWRSALKKYTSASS